jgi:hypothetical protein
MRDHRLAAYLGHDLVFALHALSGTGGYDHRSAG